MNDDCQDPEFEWIRSRWKAPQPRASVDASVLAAYRTHMSRQRRKRWFMWAPIPVAAAIAVAFVTLSKSPQPDYYRAVAQPRFIVISQGERP